MNPGMLKNMIPALGLPKHHGKLAGLLPVLLLALCGCSTPRNSNPVLPNPISFNWGAGCGNHLLVKLRVEDSDELWFCVDTGSPVTVISPALESMLGAPVGHQKIDFAWHADGKSTATKYRWPKIYCAGTPLQPGKVVVVSDQMQRAAGGHRLAGILGMDCLQHYCLQMDFDAHTIRFVAPATLVPASLGEAFPLAYTHPKVPFGIRSASPQYPFPLGQLMGNLSARVRLFGSEEWCTIDTGAYDDGSLRKGQMVAAMRDLAAAPSTTSRTNGTMVVTRSILPAYALGRLAYTNIVLLSRKGADENVLGLRLLARNLVTFDFPNRTMYLKQQTVGPLELYRPGEREAFQTFIKAQKANGGLPGLSSDAELDLEPATYSFRSAEPSTADGTTRYYRFQRVAGANDAWVLCRAWRMDEHDQLVEEYPLP